MDNNTDFMTAISTIYNVSGTISVVTNLLMIILILTKSSAQFGGYAYLMMTISLFEMLYSVLHIILVPMHISQGSAMMVISRSWIEITRHPIQFILLLTYVAFFGASLSIFALQFIYRHLVITGSSLISSFNSWKVILWLMVPVAVGSLLAVDCSIFLDSDVETKKFLRNMTHSVLGVELDDYEFIGVHLYEFGQNGTFIPNFDSMFSLILEFVTVTLSLTVIFYFGINCYFNILNILNATHSQLNKNLQSQLFNALVLQTLIPVFFMHLPSTIIFFCVILSIDTGRYGAILSMSIAIYPALDPIPNFIIIKSYRDAILGNTQSTTK